MIINNNKPLALQEIQEKMQQYFQSHWKLFLAEGILLIILGLVAILIPHFFTVAIVVSLGWILLFGGVFLITRALMSFGMPGVWLWLFMGFLQAMIGFLFLSQPLDGILTLTLLVTLFFALEGFSKIAFALMMRPLTHWGYVLFSGITALFLAIVVWAGWPGTAEWILGLLFGINLFFGGLSLVNISLHHKVN
jgi:uncharacterized membrane protein HdeD (DUF308 family)